MLSGVCIIIPISAWTTAGSSISSMVRNYTGGIITSPHPGKAVIFLQNFLSGTGSGKRLICPNRMNVLVMVSEEWRNIRCIVILNSFFAHSEGANDASYYYPLLPDLTYPNSLVPSHLSRNSFTSPTVIAGTFPSPEPSSPR